MRESWFGNAGHRYKKVVVVAILVGLAGAMLALSPWGRSIERTAGLEWLYALRGPIAPPADVVIVSMSRRAIDRLGLPSGIERWPRALHAKLVRHLTDEGAAIIAFDIFFRNNKIEQSDRDLANAISESRRTVLFQRVERDTAFTDRSDRRIAVTDQLVSPVKIFAQAAVGMGPFPLPKVPARVDQFWTFTGSVGDIPTLPVVALQVLALRMAPNFGQNPNLFETEMAAAYRSYLRSARTNRELLTLIRNLRNLRWPKSSELGARLVTSANRTALLGEKTYFNTISRALDRVYKGPDSQFLNYYGPPGTITTIPYDKLIENIRNTGIIPNIAGKVVFVGVSDFTSTEGKDTFHTVFSRKDGIQLSGVEILATAFGNILHNETLHQPDIISTILLLFAFGAAATIVAAVLGGFVAVAACALMGLATFGGSFYAFSAYNLWLPISVPLLVQLPLALFLGSITQYLQVRQLSELLKSFLPKRLRRIADGRSLENVWEKVYGICLFVDLRGYTAASENVELTELGNSTSQFFDLIEDVTSKSRGMFLRGLGDGGYAVWRDQEFVSHNEMRLEACGAALKIQNSIEGGKYFPCSLKLPASIGLHEGEFLLGFMGKKGRLELSAVGDTINTAARIEGLNRQLGTSVLVSGKVARGLDEEFLFRPFGEFQLVGKSEIIEISALLQRQGNSILREVDLVNRSAELLALRLNSGSWTEVLTAADHVLEQFPEDGPTQFFKDYAAKQIAAGKIETARSPVVMVQK